ncbi:TIR domain-containing protein [Proteiniclasticum sp. SCR006]|uniref:TIR domain-containing protein n=1 Tax=Proteiniclasticum aestuarii TaxID=2817862 RepID=A0A939HBC8_9CLOT|nr:TIR domain-containing protein [Proteiniclasticum aestuarii]MBO1264485.1 TIR domain-containing protein [Proteiniclasticum aestuarii]
MGNAIEKPKVFISYARSGSEYDDKVLALAERLVTDGIDVVLDKWDLKPGQDMYDFMESSVTDSKVTNVLILLNEQYKLKADSRKGGVGTETQIISPQIYCEVKQDKFIPVVFERGPKGEVYVPEYLTSRYHIDLTYAERFDKEYAGLARILWGFDIFRKPELGNRPSWISEPNSIKLETESKLEELKRIMSENARKEKYNDFLDEVKNEIMLFKKEWINSTVNSEEYIALYSETKNIRDKFLALLKYSSVVDDSYILIANAIEELANNMRQDILIREIQKTLIHELFLYTITWYLKKKNYRALGNIFERTYFKTSYGSLMHDSYNMFYINNTRLDNAINERDDKKYYSGTAQYWIENLNIDICNKDEFVFGDLLCYQHSVIGVTYYSDWNWFPLTYGYGLNNKLLQDFSVRFKSMEQLDSFKEIFGYNDYAKFIERLTTLANNYKDGDFRQIRYPRSFDSAPMIFSFIMPNEIGTLK